MLLRLILLPLILASCVICENSVRNIYWNTTTAREAGQQPRTVIVNAAAGGLASGHQYDQVNLICPVYKPGSPNPEQHIIYSVEKEEFEACRVTSPRPRIVAVCNRPQTFMYFTITFRSFTPTPGGLEFRPGRDYYFISTSNTKDIHRRVGGWCASHNMKMIFRVTENKAAAAGLLSAEKDLEDSGVTQPTPPKLIPTPAAFWSKYWNARVPDTKENYIHAAESAAAVYRQTSRDTYLGGEDETGGGQFIYHPRRLDNSVDITITASALSAAATAVSTTNLLTAAMLMVASSLLV